MRRVHGHRALLNMPGHHSTAAIIAEVEDTRSWPDGKNRMGGQLDRYSAQPTITFNLTDCDNKVTIEFDIDTDNSYENSLHKVDEMAKALRAFRKGLVTERARFIKREGYIPADRRYGL